MDLAEVLRQQITDPLVGCGERARLRCQLSKELEQAGDFEGAREAMGELWSRVGERPVIAELDQRSAGEVLWQVGVLTSSIGSVRQIEGAQEVAKDLISESLMVFEALREAEKVAEAQTDLAVCYWRQGAYDEARVILREVLTRLADTRSEVYANALLRSAIVERSAKRYDDALRLHVEAAPFFDSVTSHALKGKFHNGFAIVLEILGTSEQREDCIDQALVEYTAASFHFEQAGQVRHRACVENNLGMLFLTIGKYGDAHEHLSRARQLFASLRDTVHTAQVDETRARAMLAEGRCQEAEKVVRLAVQTLEKGGEHGLLAEALTTQGAALARLGDDAGARLTLRRALEVARQAGDLEGAGQAALTAVEELGRQLDSGELAALYECAAELLEKSQHPGILQRLSACARLVVGTLSARSVAATGGADCVEAFDSPRSWEGLCFWKEVRRYEKHLIARALQDAGGVVSRAAKMLGFRHYQSLVALLNGRHRDMLPSRSPIVPRRRSIIRAREPRQTITSRRSSRTRGVTILLVEDNRMVAETLKETLEAYGWRVEACAEGTGALRALESDARFDLLLLDNDLPGVTGTELVRLARKLTHRRRTPIVMLSASDVEDEARRVGADVFLGKPDGVPVIAETITRLLGHNAQAPA